MNNIGRVGLLMSPIAYKVIEEKREQEEPMLAGPSQLFGGSLRPVMGMEIVTHDAIPIDIVYRIPHELVDTFRINKEALELYIKVLRDAEKTENDD